MPNCVRGYVARTYRGGDEIELVRLFNRVYEDFAGFVPRTPEYWRWCCLSRPDVEAEGIVVVNDGSKIVGYGVVGKSGNIWELCYDPAYDGEEIVSTVLEWGVNYVEKVGGDSVAFNAPREDSVFRDVCLKLGFAETSPPWMFIGVLDFPRFIQEVVNCKREKLRGYDEDFLIRLRGSPSWSSVNVIIRIRNGDVSVKEVTEEAAGVLIESDIQTVTSCILGTKGLLKTFLGSKFKVRPYRKYLKVLKFFSLIRIRDPWFSPGSDFG